MATALSLIGTGVGFGVVHVLTGPDHLSALATLSANVRSASHAFFLGVRWGIGHSTGLLLVGVTLILISKSRGGVGDDDKIRVPDRLSTVFESIVGVFMLALGAYGLRRAWAKRPGVYDDRETADTITRSDGDEEIQLSRPTVQKTPADEEAVQSTSTSAYSSHSHFGVAHIDSVNTATSDSSEVEIETSSFGMIGTFWRRCASKVSTRTVALLAGIVHGIAGPGGVLGVIPAVQLHDGKLAAVYLGCFCASSTLTMGIFATFYGLCSSRLGTIGDQPTAEGRKASSRDFWIESMSASLSIIVGIVWLVLLCLGKLDEVFP